MRILLTIYLCGKPVYNLKTRGGLRIKKLNRAIALSLGVLVAPQTLADLNDGLIAYYPFNGNTNDESGSGNHGNVYGATLTEDRFGNPESAYRFDGQDDYVDFGHVNTNISSKFSMSADIKALQDRSDFRVVLSKGLKSRSHFEIYIEKSRTFPYIPGEFRFYSPNLQGTGASGSIVGDFGSGKIVDDNTFHHLVVTYDGSKTDGLMVYEESTTGNYVDETAQFFIGRQTDVAGGQMLFKGIIDEIRIYNRVLSKAEIKELYDGVPNGKENPCTEPEQATISQNLQIHIPEATYGDMKLWVDFKYVPNQDGRLLFEVTDYGPVE